MAKEIKGFNEAYKRATHIESAKKYYQKAQNKAIKKLVSQGIPKEVAKVMSKQGLLK